MATYEKAPPETQAIAAALIEQSFPDLHQAGATVLVMFAYPTLDSEGQPKSPAISFQGHSIAAKSKKTSLKDRAAGLEDIVILVDGYRYRSGTIEEQEAILYGQLYSFVVQRDKEGKVLPDDLGRPRLKQRPVDFVTAGFVSTIERYAEAAPESQSMLLTAKLAQKHFPWG